MATVYNRITLSRITKYQFGTHLQILGDLIREKNLKVSTEPELKYNQDSKQTSVTWKLALEKDAISTLGKEYQTTNKDNTHLSS